nr:MAG TPA: nucleotide kinase [Caudoviricetes sp.]
MTDDLVNNPRHYTSHPSGIEAIEVTKYMSFCLGNVMKYIWRADHKSDRLQDLEKAAWYLQQEIQLERQKNENR